MSTKEYTWDMGGCCRGEEGMRDTDEFCRVIDEADTTDFDPEETCNGKTGCQWYSPCVPQVVGCCRGEPDMRGKDEYCSDMDEVADPYTCNVQRECQWYSTCPDPPVPQVVDCNRPCTPDEKQRMPNHESCGTIAPYMCLSGDAIGGCNKLPNFWSTRPPKVCGDCCKYV